MTGTYSFGLVALSFAIAVAASYVAFALAGRIAATRGWASTYWLAGGAVAMGTGIWSMHFIGMLAFHLPIPMAFDTAITAASLLIAIGVSAFALHVVSRTALDWPNLAFGGVVMGLGIAAMHYTGMAAMEVSPPINYSPYLLVASMAIAIAASVIALALTFRLRTNAMAHTIWKRLVGALVMGAGIVGMHYTGMAAAEFAPGTICTSPAGQLDQYWLAVAVAACTLLFLAATMLILTVDVRLAQQLDSANAKIAELARTDPLTGLANRRTFLERLDDAFRARRRDAKPSAVLCLDLDGFKDINDTLGHPMGDALLVEVAARLKRAVRQSDLVARFGGDEFAILLAGIDDASAGKLAAKIGDALAASYCINDKKMHVTASMGIAPFFDMATSPEALIMQADLAMYRAKDEGRNCYRFHDRELDRQVRRRTLLARDLHHAIEREELELLYQPQVQIGSGRIIGFEALLRWNHPARGAIEPSIFLPIAETTGGIAAIGSWILDQACRQVREWQDEGVASPLVAVDISAGQLKTAPDLPGEMSAALTKWGIAAASIELELTESVLAQANQKHEVVINRLGELGFRLAIQDFGMGYSSLSVLAACPVGRLKIAGNLVAGALRNDRSATVVCAAVQLAHQLGVDVVADGVETEAQVFLTAAGCDQAQGPFFFAPLSARDATMLLKRATFRSPSQRDTSSVA